MFFAVVLHETRKSEQWRGSFVRKNEGNLRKMGKSGKNVIFKNVDFSMFLKFSHKKIQNF